MSQPSYICAGLYVSDWRVACLVDYETSELGIGHVITAMDDEELDYYGIEGEIDFKGATWTWLNVEDVDEEPLGEEFERICREIDAATSTGKSVLVHCMAGVSRSPTLAAAYLMWHYKWTVVQALAFLKERRPCVDPNEGFKRQLLVWEARLMLDEPKIDVAAPQL
jgi:protein-tyrosine phosphatase